MNDELTVLRTVLSSILFVIAKKKQWAIRSSIRASLRARRLTAAYRQSSSMGAKTKEQVQGSNVITTKASKRKGVMVNLAERDSIDHDLEMGEIENVSEGTKK